MSDDYTTIPIFGISWLTEVRLYDETWEHIAQHHPEFKLELPVQRAGLEQAIANPSSIHESVTDPQRSVVFVSERFTYFGDAVVVPIRHVEDTSGRVVTAYFGGTYQGNILWSAGND